MVLKNMAHLSKSKSEKWGLKTDGISLLVDGQGNKFPERGEEATG